jgi:hypothetical protein
MLHRTLTMAVLLALSELKRTNFQRWFVITGLDEVSYRRTMGSD